MEGSPWTFNRHLLLLHKFMDDWRPEDYKFPTSPFWLRVQDLRIGYRNTKKTVAKIGNNIGKLTALDKSLQSKGWASSLRKMGKMRDKGNDHLLKTPYLLLWV